MYTNLGLDQDLVNAVTAIVESCGCKETKEELHPNQKVLDKNKNGKLDADDFKKLRKEEEELDEEQLDELSKSTLGSYVKKAAADAVGNAGYIGAMRNSGSNTVNTAYEKLKKRNSGVASAITKLTKEQVEEIEALAAKHGLGE